jgi:ubiquinone/menaquinone biosynthesis C-methylase UbiE
MIKYKHQDRYERAFCYLKPTANEIILDGGCREGYFVRKCNEKQISVIGVDLSLNSLKEAKVNACDALIRADLTHLPFSDKTVDKVSLLDVIEHFDKNGRIDCLNEVNRVLRDDGLLLISTPNSLCRPFYALWTIFRGLFLGGGFYHIRHFEAIWYCGRDHRSTLSPFSVRQIFPACGFDIVKTCVDTYDNLPYWVELFDNKILCRVWMGGLLWCMAKKRRTGKSK